MSGQYESAVKTAPARKKAPQEEPDEIDCDPVALAMTSGEDPAAEAADELAAAMNTHEPDYDFPDPPESHVHTPVRIRPVSIMFVKFCKLKSQIF